MLNVFEISRMTNHNGPGIRTLVHFKGCPLRCVWCSTPESQSREAELGYKVQRCIGDGACLQACPAHAIRPAAAGEKGLLIDRAKCTGCFVCVRECYAHALTRIGRAWSVGELLKEIRKDELFFQNSGGGVTFSGGEPLMFVDGDMIELYRGVKEAGISIGVDTTGFVPWESIAGVLPFVDFFLWDLKVMDREKHKALTGADNRLILENLQRVEGLFAQYGTRVYVRCIQVPGMTDSDENLLQTCAFLRGMRCIEEIDLINFHHMGKKRYEYIQRDYAMDEVEPMEKARLEEKKKLVEAQGFRCRISS